MIKPYKVALIQPEVHVIVDPKQRDVIVEQNLERILTLLTWACNRLGDVRLAAFCEFGLTGMFRPRDADEWLELAEPIPGPVTDRIGEVANARGCYITGNVFERDDTWPGRLFNTTFIVSPEREVVLKYRKINGPNHIGTYTGADDIYTEYTNRYGELSMFPVAETDIGVLGALVCTDIIYPEMARALALQGAEVLIHPTAEPWSDVDQQWDVFRRARACENWAYLASAAAGAFVGSDRPRSGYRGHSQVIDYNGNVLSITPAPGEAVCFATIDVDAVRELRTRRPGEGGLEWNQLAGLRADLYAQVYRRANRWPSDGWADRLLTSETEPRRLYGEIIDRLVAEGRLREPASLEDRVPVA
jgi:predicted amidohydrolase